MMLIKDINNGYLIEQQGSDGCVEGPGSTPRVKHKVYLTAALIHFFSLPNIRDIFENQLIISFKKESS